MPKKKGIPNTKADNPVTEELKAAYVEEIKKSGKLYLAADKLNTTYTTMYLHRQSDPEFDKAVGQAIEIYNDKLEEMLDSQATLGNPTAAIFRLKGQRPEKYKELKQVENTGSVTVNFKMIMET